MNNSFIKLFLVFILFFEAFFAYSQDYVHQVVILNEGYFDYSLNQSVIPPTIGFYDPSTQTYTTIDTLNSARFASDLIIDDNYFYVAADNMIYKYDKNSHNLITSQQVDGVRNIAVWNDKMIVTRGDYDNITFSPIFFSSYVQIYNLSDLSLFLEIDTMTGPKWATQNVIIDNDKAYVAINNAYEWGNEKGLIGVLDLNTFMYIDEIDLGPEGINPDNMMMKDEKIYTINNKDWSGSSISQVSLLSGAVSTISLAAAPTGCGTSCLRGNKINYQISGDSILNEWDIDLLPNNGVPLSVNQFFYTLSHDSINNLLYGSVTDYVSTGFVYIYDSDDNLVFDFSCGVAPGKIAFDMRSFNTGISSFSSSSSNNPAVPYDLIGRKLNAGNCLNMMYINDNQLFYKTQ